MTALQDKLTPITDSIIHVSTLKSRYLKAKPNFNFERSLIIDSTQCVAVSDYYYAYAKELEILTMSQDFKIKANRMLLYRADSLISGLESSLYYSKQMHSLCKREAIACRNTMSEQYKLIDKQEQAIDNLERMNKIYRRRVRVVAGVGAVAVVTAVILSIVK